VLDGIVDRGSPVRANRLRAHLNTLFNWAKGRDFVQSNPLDGIKPPSSERPRDRVLSNDEIRWFWLACDRLGQPFGWLCQLLLPTGQRRGEVGGMTEREIDGDEWTIPAIASKLGCSPDSLRGWCQRAERDAGKRAGLSSEEKSRIKELERENRELRQANEILKKASAYFAHIFGE